MFSNLRMTWGRWTNSTGLKAVPAFPAPNAPASMLVTAKIFQLSLCYWFRCELVLVSTLDARRRTVSVKMAEQPLWTGPRVGANQSSSPPSCAFGVSRNRWNWWPREIERFDCVFVSHIHIRTRIPFYWEKSFFLYLYIADQIRWKPLPSLKKNAW